MRIRFGKILGRSGVPAATGPFVPETALPTVNRLPAHGFTLVEVMLAFAVVSIGIIAILGLLPIGLQSSRDAADNTLAATIALDTFSNLRTNAFNTATICDACGPGGTPVGGIPLATYSGTVSNAYDFEGFSTANWAAAYYKVILNYRPQTPLQLTHVTATVVWPAQSKAPPNTNTFVTSIAKYEL